MAQGWTVTPLYEAPSNITVQELVISEVSDFCAGLGNPGEPLAPEDIQQRLLERLLPLLAVQDRPL
ncbi:hypothetical protein C4B62_11030 [Serratia marcescens]|nr:hypothetical protein C4B62_11030 [Serratia marcescens]